MGLMAASGLFTFSAVVVVIAAIALARGADVIAEKSGWGHVWVGSLLLAGATSLPEFVTDISSVRIGSPALAAGDVLGANMLNMSNLAILTSIFAGRYLVSRLSRQEMFIAWFAIALTAIATVIVIVGSSAKLVGPISVPSLVLLGGYLVGFRLMGRFASESDDSGESRTDHTLRWGWLVFWGAAAIIFVSGPAVAISARSIAELSGISEGFVGVLGVALVTTLPELTAAATALRIGAPALAFAGMFGTNAFNMAVFGVVDFFSPEGAIFGDLDESHIAAGAAATVLMLLVLAQFRARQRVPPGQRSALVEAGTVVVVGGYAGALFLVFALG